MRVSQLSYHGINAIKSMQPSGAQLVLLEITAVFSAHCHRNVDVTDTIILLRKFTVTLFLNRAKEATASLPTLPDV